MNHALEFHDSHVESMVESGKTLRIILTAYVHRSDGRPGVDAGAGYTQPVELVFAPVAAGSLSLQHSGALCDGTLIANGQSMSLVPLPYSAAGHISLSLSFTSGATFSATATSVSCAATGEAQFVEHYAAAG